MKALRRLESVGAPIPHNAVDTDIIFPARFLLLLDREGLGRYAFAEWRQGNEPFVLDTPPYLGAQILVAGEHFGTGSSREQAVWALADLGIRCIIARSFGEIFHANCLKNGVLPIRLDSETMEAVEDAARKAQTKVIDLEQQRIELADGLSIPFDIEPHHKRSLLAGLDETGLILADEAEAITNFETKSLKEAPWLPIAADRFENLPEGDVDR